MNNATYSIVSSSAENWWLPLHFTNQMSLFCFLSLLPNFWI